MTTTLGTVIRSRREAAFLSQKELAHRINVSNGTISRIESGDGLHPDPQTLRTIADILHIDYYYLLTLNGQIDDAPDIRMIHRGVARPKTFIHFFEQSGNLVKQRDDTWTFQLPFFRLGVFVDVRILYIDNTILARKRTPNQIG